MPNSKIGTSKKGAAMHYSVGAIIMRDEKYLLIDRAVKPFGYAAVAGHIDKDEGVKEALMREVKEEVGLDVISSELLCEEELNWNHCSKGAGAHHWYVYDCEVTGEINRSMNETHSVRWYTVEQINELKLEPVWEYWFKKLHIL